MASPVALAWHDATCPEGAECRDRPLHALSAPVVNSGVLDAFLVELDKHPAGPRPGRTESAIQRDVREFHKAFDLPVRTTPNVRVPELAMRLRILREEVRELHAAARNGDTVKVADALGDIVFVANGDAHTFGINLDAVLAEVYRSNMSKLDAFGRPIHRADGKVVKGPHFIEPNLEHVLGIPAGPARDVDPGVAAMPEDPFWWDAACPSDVDALDALEDGTVLVDDTGAPATKSGRTWWVVREGVPAAWTSAQVLGELTGPLRVMPPLR